MKAEKLYPFLIVLLVGLLVSLSFYAGLFSGLENFFEDLFFSSKPVHPDIVIIAIDSESINKIGQWPWPRAVFGKALLEIEKATPKSVGIDVIFAEPSRFGQADDSALARALSQLSFLVAMPVEAEPLILSKNNPPRAGNFLKTLPILANAKNVILSHVNLILDDDGVARRLPLKVGEFNAMSYETAKQSGLKIPNEEKLDLISRIVFSGPTGSIRKIPFWRVLEGETKELLKDKVILIGATSPDLHDEKPTPFSKGTQMPGVEIQANIMNMLLSGYRLAPLSAPLTMAWIFAAALIAELIFLFFRGAFLPLAVNLVVGLAYLITIFILFDFGIAVNFVHINFAWFGATAGLLAFRYFTSEKGRKEIQQIFSKYVSKEVLEDILKNPDKVKLGGEVREVTVFFSDIKGFTTLSEKMSPQELVGVLNEYFTLMTGEVLKYGGVLDKYIGDAIMAFWGAPIDDENQADNALKAGLGMIKKLEIL
ncbi:MAG: adenylate/guanylate cyclase domain-containing protein, partial [bacterium]|nr:adenylate/guanylate cyclase domain-containing protein [bacterium]